MRRNEFLAEHYRLSRRYFLQAGLAVTALSPLRADDKPTAEKPAAPPSEAKPEAKKEPTPAKRAKPEKAGARVWISVKLKADKTPEIDTIDVTLRVCGVSRTIKLTETGKTTGEFRCDKSGVLLVSEEDPDSNVSEEKAIERKARPSGWSK